MATRGSLGSDRCSAEAMVSGNESARVQCRRYCLKSRAEPSRAEHSLAGSLFVHS